MGLVLVLGLGYVVEKQDLVMSADHLVIEKKGCLPFQMEATQVLVLNLEVYFHCC
jgi:hypothetical protein